jgi:flagellar biosynthetic protein FliO
MNEAAQLTELAGPGIGEALIRSMLALLFVCGLAYGALRALKRWGGAGWRRGEASGGGIRMESRLALEPRRSVCVIAVDGRRFLLGVSEGQIATLAELSPGALAEDNAQGRPSRVVGDTVAEPSAKGTGRLPS